MRRKIVIAMNKFIPGSRHSGFEQTHIAHAVRAAENGQELGMNVQNDLHGKPIRLPHFASALNVFA